MFEEGCSLLCEIWSGDWDTTLRKNKPVQFIACLNQNPRTVFTDS